MATKCFRGREDTAGQPQWQLIDWQPMKILLVSSLYTPYVLGGAERSVQMLAEALLKLGEEVLVATLAPAAESRTEEVNGVPVHYLALQNFYWPFGNQDSARPLKPIWHALDSWNFRMAKSLGALLDRESPDVVHTNSIAGFSVAAWSVVKKRRLPLVHTLRDYYLLCPRSTMFRNDRNCRKICTDCRFYASPRRRATQLIDAIAGNSQFMLDRHHQYGCFTTTKVQRVIYNSWNVRPDASPTERAADTPLQLGYLGRLHPTKGIELLLKAVSRQAAHDCEIWIGGHGTPDYEADLRSSWTQPYVHFMGFVPPASLFKKIDVLVVPSLWHEPLPRAICEAYVHGIPVIGSNRGGIPEVIEEGRTGYVFDPSQPASLDSAIERFSKQPQGIAAMRNYVSKKSTDFAGEHVAQAYRNLYIDVQP